MRRKIAALIALGQQQMRAENQHQSMMGMHRWLVHARLTAIAE